MTITPGVDYEAVKKEYAEFLTWYELGTLGENYLKTLGYRQFTKKEFAETHHIDDQTLRNWERDSGFWETSGYEEMQKLVRMQLPKAIIKTAQKGSAKELSGIAYPPKPLPILGQPINNLTVNVDGKKVSADVDPFEKLRIDIIEFCGKANIPCFFYSKARYILLEGGRCGGKSETVARYVLWYLRNAKNTKILCGRELQNSIKESVKSLLDRIIFDYDLTTYFVSTDNEIYCPLSGTSIIFKGLKNATSNNADTLKSMDNVSLVWIEEAQTTRQMTIDKLDPTIRVENVEMIDGSTRKAQLIFTYNRQLESDPVHNYFVESKMVNALHIYITYLMNPFCPKTLFAQAETMKKSNYNKWLHIWMGEPQLYFEDSLWPGDLISKMRKSISFDRTAYSRIVVACDPAQTESEFSNEYGITVEGLTHARDGHVIADVSGNYSPNVFAQKAIDAYYLYKADAIVVEVNAGGDFIKNTILTIDPKVFVSEVRATKDKSKRAVPIANLAQMGKIFHICGGHAKMESQMSRMTSRGFEGAPGESPDRLDSMVWGFVDLFNLSEMSTVELVFKSTMFDSAGLYYQTIHSDIAYVGFDGMQYGIILCDIIQKQDESFMKFLVKDYFKGNKEDITAQAEELLINHKIKELNIPDDITGLPIINNLANKFVGVKPIASESYITKALAERVVNIIPHVQVGKVCVLESLPIKTFNNTTGNLLLKELCEYNPEFNKIDRPLLSALCNALFLEYDLA